MALSSDIALIPVASDLDVTNAAALKKTIDAMVDAGCRRVILNMAGARYVDSAGMALILSEMRQLRQLGGLLSLVGVSDEVYRCMNIARLVDLIPVSRANEQRRAIPELDPATRPLWTRSRCIDQTRLAVARTWLTTLLSTLALSPDEVFDMTLAAGEALGNAVDHGCPEGTLLTLYAYPDRVIIDVSDEGCGFDELTLPKNDNPFLERGRGIKLMHLLADAVSISPRSTGTGTTVRLVKLVQHSD